MQLMRIRAIGLSAMLMQSAPTSCIIFAPSTILVGFRLWGLLGNSGSGLVGRAEMFIECSTHGGNMVGGRATTAAYELHSRPGEAQRVICTIIGSSHVEEEVFGACWQTSIGLRREQLRPGPGNITVLDFSNHFLQCIQRGGRAHATVGAHDIHT